MNLNGYTANHEFPCLLKPEVALLCSLKPGIAPCPGLKHPVNILTFCFFMSHFQ